PNGPTGSASAAVRACSNVGVTTAFNTGLYVSIRSMAASTSSRALIAPVRTSIACPVASRRATSVARVMDAWLDIGRSSVLAHEDHVERRAVGDALDARESRVAQHAAHHCLTCGSAGCHRTVL